MTTLAGETGVIRPLATFALFAYNQEKYIREAVESAFSQTYEPLEIILSDDCSTDRTFEIMREMAAAYDGPHRLTLRKNESNLGLGGHVNAVFSVSRGDVVILAAGDDISLPGRSSVSVDLLAKNHSASAVLMSADTIDEGGTVFGEQLATTRERGRSTQSLQDLLKWRHVTFGAARAIRRNVFWKFGLLNDDCPTEDTPLLLRSLICGDNILVSEKGLLYRKHEGNLSSPASLSRINVSTIYKQYYRDIDTAQQSLLINGDVARKLRDWASIDEKVRSVNLRIVLKEKLALSDVLFCMRHPSFTEWSKIRIVLYHVFASWMFR